MIIFLSSPNIAKNLMEFCGVFCKLDHLARNIFPVLKGDGEPRAVNRMIRLVLIYSVNGGTIKKDQEQILNRDRAN